MPIKIEIECTEMLEVVLACLDAGRKDPNINMARKALKAHDHILAQAEALSKKAAAEELLRNYREGE